MAEYYIGQIFDGSYPPDAAVWCNNRTDCYIKEIAPQGPIRRFEIVAIPVPTDSEAAALVRYERDKRLDDIEWRVDRYRDQRDAEVITDDTPAQYQSILAYMQALRDVPEQSGFPRNVVWPVAPNLG